MSEDDTFNILRRIPFGELRRRLHDIDAVIFHHRITIRDAIEYNNKEEATRKFYKRWLPWANRYPNDYRSVSRTFKDAFDRGAWDEYFAGTGWTPDDYLEKIDAIILTDHKAMSRKNDKNHYILIAGCILGGSFATVIIMIIGTGSILFMIALVAVTVVSVGRIIRWFQSR